MGGQKGGDGDTENEVEGLDATELRREEARTAIERHIAEVGPNKFDDLRKQFADIPHATWYRMLRKAKTGRARPKAVKRARTIIDESIGKQAIMERASRTLPEAPSPEFVARGGVRAIADFNFMAQASEIYADAQLLREHSSKVEEGEDGVSVRKITLPRSFSSSINQRARLMDTFLSIMARAYEFDRIREFYRTIMEEIAAESPACAARIAGRMEDLNARQGFTYAPIGTVPGGQDARTGGV